MTYVYLAALVCFAVSVGWWLRGEVRQPPEGIDAAFWNAAVKAWRAKRRAS